MPFGPFKSWLSDDQPTVAVDPARLAGDRRRARVLGEDRPPEGHVLADVARVASLWTGRPYHVASADTAVPSPETLISAAEEWGVDVTFAETALEAITDTQFPCVILTVSGGSRVLTGRGSDGALEVLAGDRKVFLDPATLAPDYAGVVFLVKPRLAPPSKPLEFAPPPVEPTNDADVIKAGFEFFKAIAREAFDKHRRLFALLLLAGLISNLLTLALPLFSMSVYDRVVPHLAFETLWALGLGVLVAIMVDLAVRFVRLKLVDAISLAVSLKLQAQLYRRLVTSRLDATPRTPGTAAQVVRDVDTMAQIMPSMAVGTLIDLPFFVLLCLFLYALGGPIVLAPIMGVVLLVVVHILAHRAAHEASAANGQHLRTQVNQMAESVAAIETIKAARMEHMLMDRWERHTDQAGFSAHQLRLWTGFASTASMVVTQVVIVAVIMIGVYQISLGGMTVGALVASTIIVGRALAPIAALIGLFERAAHLARSAIGATHMLNLPVERGGDRTRGTAKTVDGRFDLTGVSFSYTGDARPILSEIDIHIEPGERVGLIGRVGSGKSTLLRLLARFHDASSGSLLIDGFDARQTSPRELREGIGYMRQDPALIDDSLRANLTLGLGDVDRETFDLIAEVSGVRDFAARHPKGYGLEVGPRGERLSGGERQMVALARTLMARPNVLLLDEPTAAMDNTLEARVVKQLKGHVGDRTLIIATHRAPVLALVDRLIWLDNGRVLADGPKDEVLKRLGSADAAQRSA
jgi:ATP-binding cassette, subfamily C, bacterial LapB